MLSVHIVLVAIVLCVRGEDISDTVATKTIRILSLVQWEDELERPYSGWDAGPDMLAAGRVAVREVNERLDILPGYHLEMIEGRHDACGLTEANLGVNDLVRYGINPPNATVAAVLGFFCSTSAQIISPLAGRADLVQLSAANSVVFRRESNRFPHLWRILASADIYAEMMVALMHHYNWTRIAVVQDFETIYHSGIAESFLLLIRNTKFQLVYHGGLIQTRESLINKTLEEIKEKGARIVFLQTTGPQTAKFLCIAAQRGMVYPLYQWIITDFFLSGIVEELGNSCSKEVLLKGANGTLTGFFDLESDSNFTNASGESYSEYKEKYLEELVKTRADYYDTGEVRGDVLYAGLLYDQVWAFTLAMHNAIPAFAAANISIENYAFNQPIATSILEESLSRVSFRGATGLIEFSEEREVETLVNIYQIDSNVEKLDEADKLIGKYDPRTDTINMLSSLQLPIDIIEIHVSYIKIYGAALLYTATVAVAVFLTVILSCLMYHRSQPQIKASSPMFSLIMFVGCYSLCAACIVSTTYSSFSLSKPIFEFLCSLRSVLLSNGLSLIFVTLFVKLLRIHKIFNNKGLKYLGWFWTNYFLTFLVVIITLIPNVILVIWISVDRLTLHISSTNITSSPLVYMQQEHGCNCNHLLVWYALIFSYLSFILILVVILAARTRRIKHANFKDTKKVNVFIFVFVLTFSIHASLFWIFIERNMINYAHIIIIMGLLLLVCECQLMLFLPKVVNFTRKRRAGQYSITEGFIAIFAS